MAGLASQKPPIPYLEPVVTEQCEKCGSTERLSNKRIFWFNVNEEHNTGLPDYWLLKIDADSGMLSGASLHGADALC